MKSKNDIKKWLDQVMEAVEKRMDSRESESFNALKEDVRNDLAAFMVYLSMQDGFAAREELAEISEVCGITLDGDNIQDFIEEYGIASFEFANTIPESYKKVIEEEKTNNKPDNQKAVSDEILEVYQKIGAVIVSADGRVSESETTGVEEYTEMLARYKREN